MAVTAGIGVGMGVPVDGSLGVAVNQPNTRSCSTINWIATHARTCPGNCTSTHWPSGATDSSGQLAPPASTTRIGAVVVGARRALTLTSVRIVIVSDDAVVTVSGTVDTVTSRQVFISNSMTQAAGYFSSGEVEWLTGANAGRRMEIKEFSNKQFTLVLPMPNNIAAGDTFNAIAGCDKTFNTCFSKFSNAVNFRGEPYVPGMDKMLQTAATANDLQTV